VKARNYFELNWEKASPEARAHQYWWRALVHYEPDPESYEQHLRWIHDKEPADAIRWRTKEEQQAFRYELARRVGALDVPIWPMIGDQQRQFIGGSLGEGLSNVCLDLVLPGGTCPPGFWQVDDRIAFDLKCDDTTLTNAFLEMVNHARNAHSITAPERAPRSGRAFRPPAWNTLESLDNVRSPGRPKGRIESTSAEEAEKRTAKLTALSRQRSELRARAMKWIPVVEEAWRIARTFRAVKSPYE
jgi:hypothetical protein